MCRVHNIIGALNDVDSHLIKNNLDEFNSLTELIKFNKEYSFTELQIILEHRQSVQKERESLEQDIPQLIEEVSKKKFEYKEKLKQKLEKLYRKVDELFLPNSNFTTIIKDLFLNFVVWTRIWFTSFIFYFKTIISTKKNKKLLSEKNIRYEFICKNFDEAVNQSSSIELQVLSTKRNLIKEIESSIYGAIGEQKVVDMLEKLSDDYILINDFTCSFQPAIFNSKENNHIKSVQIDHILISPSGVFLIETKNWSKFSVNNRDLRSPVQQVKRTSFALFKILANCKLKKHHWGERKIPIKNVVVLINNVPIEEFQFVKILSLSELVNYVTYFSPCFSKEETEYIAEFLLKRCDKKSKSCRLAV